jgi:predicted nucleotide-binding protein
MVPKQSAVAEQARVQTEKPRGTKIFIGHGRSLVWRELKDFIEGRLKLPYEEFNAESAAGIPNDVRLDQMLNDAAFAFVILTAEDESKDGKMQARLNVVHEAGLFQGRLSFKKAIVLLEDGCEEFSNIHGLGQIRFPSGAIKSVFEDVRRVLEREGVI